MKEHFFILFNLQLFGTICIDFLLFNKFRVLCQTFLYSSEITLFGLLVGPGRDRPKSGGTLSGYVPSNFCISGVENYLERLLPDISL